MQLPIEVRFRNVDSPPAVEALIREEVQKLERFYGGILGCHVMVERPHQHHERGNPYHIRVELTVPGGEIVVKHQPSVYRTSRQAGQSVMSKQVEVEAPHKDLRLAIEHTFKVVGRRLQDYVRRRRGQVKTHEPLPAGRVSRLLPEEDCGFLETADGREIYFHRWSVLGGQFDRLKIGALVSFVEELGEKGPQASTVRRIRSRSSENVKKEQLTHA
jgi:cold shock CspA family protein/ribosome-associated translation inhibitor RaiA